MKEEELKTKFKNYLATNGFYLYNTLKIEEGKLVINIDKTQINLMNFLYELGFSCKSLGSLDITLEIAVADFKDK